MVLGMNNRKKPHDFLIAAVNMAGSQTKLAEICDCSRPAISLMLRDGRPLPAKYVLKVEQALGISRHLLNPEIYPREEGTP